MSDIAIRVENLSKAYRIGLKEQRHETLLGAALSFLRSPFENYRNLKRLSSFENLRTQGPKASERPQRSQSPRVPESQSSPQDIIFALKDVSFEVKHGEVVGIIGRNGAGKSTLLKILSRITEPTSGHATIHGRVASLLEVGTGMHIELTGRENVYLMGTVLGMSKKEVDRKLDEIVAFAEVEKFIDTPFKRYSSGMRTRLAFAVAAHLEPEILIIDEVLAVGDLNFQNKCLGKMDEVARHGRTVLFVSHNMAAVTQLCQRGIILESGVVKFDGLASDGIDLYVRFNSEGNAPPNRKGVGRFENLRVNGTRSPMLNVGQGFEISVDLPASVDGKLLLGLVMEDAHGRRVFHDRWKPDAGFTRSIHCSPALEIRVPDLSLAPGMYSLCLGASFTSNNKPAQIASDRLLVQIRGDSDHLGRTLLVPKLEWHLKAGTARATDSSNCCGSVG